MRDLLYNSLRNAIIDFYDNEYFGYDSLKNYHLSLLDDHYNPKRFEQCGSLEDERIAFLTELQEMVDKRI